MTRDIDQMTEAERAEFYEQHAGDIMADEGEEIPVEHSSAPASVTMSFQVSQEEARLIRKVAKAAGLTQSEWIRSMCVHSSPNQSGQGGWLRQDHHTRSEWR